MLKYRSQAQAWLLTCSTSVFCYGLAGFLGAGFGLVSAAAPLAFSPPPLLSSVKASLALNGNCRTDCSPVVLKVTSTRRLLAKRTVRRFFRIFCFSAALS